MALFENAPPALNPAINRAGSAMAAELRAPHALVHYLREVANDFHTYYNAHQFLVDDAELRDARVTLVQGMRQVVRNGLGLLGVSAPEAM